jgi:hypothetical protein
MISKKRAAIGLAIGALIGLQMSGIYVPEDFQKPILYKLIYSYMGICGSLVNFINFKCINNWIYFQVNIPKG